jgi:hypothetical protein
MIPGAEAARATAGTVINRAGPGIHVRPARRNEDDTAFDAILDDLAPVEDV